MFQPSGFYNELIYNHAPEKYARPFYLPGNERQDYDVRPVQIEKTTRYPSMSPTRMSKIESATRVVLEFNEAFNRHDVSGMMQLMSEDCVFENTAPAPDGTVYKGKETVTRFWQDFFRESPNAHIKIEEIFGLGERCVMRWRYNWEETGGEENHVRGVDIFRVRDGSIQEKFTYVKG